jgi:prepilin-type N-terminal cleavage/methylation domain-containing protein
MNRRGFTLIELVVVMVIIAIGALLLVPNLGAWLPNFRLRGATRDIVSTMRVAQMKAVSNNTQYRVNLDDAEIGVARSYVLQRHSGGVWMNDGALQTLPDGITMDTEQLPAARVVFNPNSTSSAGSVTLQNRNGMLRKITIAPATGRIRIE